MERFWLDKWKHGETGFHRATVHPMLAAHGARLYRAGTCVFVPLCGKSRDMLWLLERGCTVIGVELSEIAVAAFFDENGLTAWRRRVGDMVEWRGPSVTIYQGDLFALTAAQLVTADSFYDRAALIALAPAMRRRYAAHLQRILPPALAAGLLITLQYDSREMAGPPFAVADAEVGSLFAGRFSARLLEAVDAQASEPGLAARGLSWLTESVWLLEQKR